jgi:hypothetical protein
VGLKFKTMKQRLKDLLKIVAAFIIGISVIWITYSTGSHTIAANDNIEITEHAPPFLTQSAKEGLLEALEFYEIHHAEIVYSQAVLETGHFKSKLCVNHNNLFGIKEGNKYKHYSHWIECVRDYKNRIQNKYKDGEDYYKFLERIKYAENRTYTSLLKQITNDNRRKRFQTNAC